MQHPERQAHHLQVLTPRRRTDIAWFGPDVVHDRALEPWDEEVCAFVHDLVFDSGQAVEDDGAGAAFDVVDGGGGEGEGDGGRDGVAVHLVEGVGCHRGGAVRRVGGRVGEWVKVSWCGLRLP